MLRDKITITTVHSNPLAVQPEIPLKRRSNTEPSNIHRKSTYPGKIVLSISNNLNIAESYINYLIKLHFIS